MKSFYKKARIYTLSFIGAIVLKCLLKTVRFKSIESSDSYDEFWSSDEPSIVAFWHNRQLMLPALYFDRPKGKNRNLSVLISAHADGRLIASIISKFGLSSVAGSSTRGGGKALLKLIKIVKAGDVVVITPDGPRGPIYKSKHGVITLASQTGAAILPLALGCHKYIRFGSWDKMFFPLPFTRGVFCLGEKIFVREDLTDEEKKEFMKTLDSKLNELTERVDSFEY